MWLIITIHVFQLSSKIRFRGFQGQSMGGGGGGEGLHGLSWGVRGHAPQKKIWKMASLRLLLVGFGT